MGENQDILTPTQTTSEQYLESIGNENAQNITSIVTALSENLKATKKEGFILAIGGTTSKTNPNQRKDIDILFGTHLTKVSGTTEYEKAATRFAEWHESLESVLTVLNREKKMEFIVQKPYPKPENPDIPSTNGKVIITPEIGKTIDIVCYSGQPIEPPFVNLYSNVEFKKA